MQTQAVWAATMMIGILLAGCADDTEPEPRSSTPVTADVWQEALSAPIYEGIVQERVVAESSLGDRMEIHLYHPEGAPAGRPTIINLSPYHGSLGLYAQDRFTLIGDHPHWLVSYFVPRGYTVALADMPGTRNSEGCFDFGGIEDQEAGHAIVEHIGTQPWSNGKVGMYGVSHVGMSQLATAVTAPEHLTTIVPIGAISSFYRYLFYEGTHYDLNMFTPPAYTAVATAPPTHVDDPERFAQVAAQTLCEAPEQNMKGLSQDGQMDAHWLERDYPSMAENVNTTVYLVHGLLDHNVKIDHATAMFEALEAAGKEPWMFVGQWGHQEPPLPDEDDDGINEWRLRMHRWFDHWLLERDTGLLLEPRVEIQDDTETWAGFDTWPAPTVGEATLFFDAAGLVDAPGDEHTVTWADVPGTYRGFEPGTALQTFTFTVGEELHVAGSPQAILDIDVDATSTHLAVLVYVDHGSGPELWNRGYLDTRQRAGIETDADWAGRETVVVPLYATDSVLPAGTDVQVVVKSSDGCGYVVGPVLFGCGPTGIVSDTTAATVTLHMGGDAEVASRFVLPLRDDAQAQWIGADDTAAS